jgi:hypothetical protein
MYMSLSDTTIAQTKASYADSTNYNKGLSQPIVLKTTGDLISENKCKFLNILVIAGITFMVLSNNQPDLIVYSE